MNKYVETLIQANPKVIPLDIVARYIRQETHTES